MEIVIRIAIKSSENVFLDLCTYILLVENTVIGKEM